MVLCEAGTRGLEACGVWDTSRRMSTTAAAIASDWTAAIGPGPCSHATCSALFCLLYLGYYW